MGLGKVGQPVSLPQKKRLEKNHKGHDSQNNTSRKLTLWYWKGQFFQNKLPFVHTEEEWWNAIRCSKKAWNAIAKIRSRSWSGWWNADGKTFTMDVHPGYDDWTASLKMAQGAEWWYPRLEWRSGSLLLKLSSMGIVSMKIRFARQICDHRDLVPVEWHKGFVKWMLFHSRIGGGIWQSHVWLCSYRKKHIGESNK